MVVGATASGITAEVLEFPQNTFRVASLFQEWMDAPSLGGADVRSFEPSGHLALKDAGVTLARLRE